jgi:hypothetical protein
MMQQPRHYLTQHPRHYLTMMQQRHYLAMAQQSTSPTEDDVTLQLFKTV